MQRNLKNDWNSGILIWEYSVRVIQWIPTWQCLDGFNLCALDESSLSIGRVNPLCLEISFIFVVLELHAVLLKISRIRKIFEGELFATRTKCSHYFTIGFLEEMRTGNPICILYANKQFPSEFPRLCAALSWIISYSFPSLYREWPWPSPTHPIGFPFIT